MVLFPRSVAVSYYLAVEYRKLLAGKTLRQVRHRRRDRSFLFAFGGEIDYLLEFSFAPPRFLLRQARLQLDDTFEIWPEVAGFEVSALKGQADNRIIDISLSGESIAGDVERFTIRFELFGALANAYLLDSAGNIEHATRVINDSRALRPGMEYAEPGTLKQLRPVGEAKVFESESAVYKLHYQRNLHRVVAEVKPGKLAFKPADHYPLVSLFQGLATGQISESVIDPTRQRLTQRIDKELKRRSSQLQQLERRLAKCSEAERYRQWGDLLMANPHAEQQADSVRVQDLYNDGEIDIPLQPGKSIIENATAYYKTAKKLERAPEHLNRRVEQVSKRIKELERASSELAQLTEPEKVKQLSKRLGLTSGISMSSGRKDVDESRPYRSFTGPGGEKIMVGKSAADNDALTFRIARSYDFWFHTQQSRGSHVILAVQDKNQKPSRQAIETAAALAAYYSDERNGDLVPVIYTRRRHVRKAGKGAPGLVIPDQVESIFVTPGLPASSEANLD